jgi:hypothetical protein
MSTLARWYFYDAGLEEPNKMASLAGMIPVSSDGNEKEEEASDIRLNRVIPLIPFLQTISDINARSISLLQFDHYKTEHNVDEKQLSEEKEVIEDMYRQVGYSALLSAFASAIELGIISSETLNGEAILDDEQ